MSRAAAVPRCPCHGEPIEFDGPVWRCSKTLAVVDPFDCETR
jgi:hypothetical protein